MIFAVVEHGAEIHDGKAGEVAACGGVANASLDRWDPVMWDGAAKDIVHKLDAFAALDRLHLDAADAELAVPAGLLLVLAFRVGFAANRLTIGHLRRLERQVHVIAFVELRHNYFDMLLAGARQEKFLGLRVAGKAQGRVLFQNFVDGHPDAIFVGARLRLDRKCDRWLGNGRGLVENRGRLVPERLARGCFLQLGHGANIARAQFGHFGKLLALHHLDVLEALRRRVVEIRQRRIVFQDAAHHLVVRDAPREGIGERLENEEGERLRVVHFALGAVALPAGLRCARRDALAGMRENIGYERQQARAADIEQRRSHQHGHNAFFKRGSAQPRYQIFDRQCPLLEKLLHQRVVAFGDHLHELFMRFLCGGGQIGGNLFDRRFAVAARLIQVRFHGHQVHHAVEIFLFADWQLDGYGGAAEDIVERLHRAPEAREFAVHPIQHKRARDIEFRAIVPHAFRGHLRARVRVNHDERGVGGHQRGFRFVDEGDRAGQVDEVDFDFVAPPGRRPFGVGEAGLDGHLSADFFFVPIRRGTSLRNLSEALRCAHGEQ